jgi:hypothetical protein
VTKRRGFGTIRVLPSGRVQVRYPDPVTGELIPAPVTFPNKRAAELYLSEVETEMSKGGWTDPRRSAVPLKEYAEGVIANRVLEERTRENYEYYIARYLEPLHDLEIGYLAQNPVIIEGLFANLKRQHP